MDSEKWKINLAKCTGCSDYTWFNLNYTTKLYSKHNLTKDSSLITSLVHSRRWTGRRPTPIPLTWWRVAECQVWRCGASIQRVGDQQLAETHHDRIVVIMIRKDHPNPSAVAWNMQEIVLLVLIWEITGENSNWHMPMSYMLQNKAFLHILENATMVVSPDTNMMCQYIRKCWYWN